MNIKPINSKLPAFSTLCSLYSGNSTAKHFEVTKVQYISEDYDYPEGAYLIWDTNSSGNLYILNSEDHTITQFSNKRDFGVTNYHFTESSDGYYVELGFYIGQIFVSVLWNINTNAELNYYKSVGKYPFKRLFLIPYTCAFPSSTIQEHELDDIEYLGTSTLKVGNLLKVKRIVQSKLLDSCVEVQTDITDVTPSIDVLINLNDILEAQIKQFLMSRTSNYLGVLQFQKGLSYPYKIEIVDNEDINSSTDWYKHPNLVSQLFNIAPIYQRETLAVPNVLVPVAPLFVGGGVIGVTTGMAIDTIRYLLDGMFNAYYSQNITGHNNVYSSPCYNFTDIVVSNVLTNLVYIAPARDLYVTSYSSKLGLFIIRFTNMDKDTTQVVFSTSSEIPKFKVSEFPIDYVQQQFPDEYLFFDYPVYVKLQFDTSMYEMIDSTQIRPIDRSALKPIVGITPIMYRWDKDSFEQDLRTDHYGNIPVNDITMDWYPSVFNVDWTKYNPNKWYVGKVETLVYTGDITNCSVGMNFDSNNQLVVNKTTEIVVYKLPSGIGIPLGISVSKNVIEDIFTQIVDNANSQILSATKNRKAVSEVLTGTVTSEFYFSVLFTVGNLLVSSSYGQMPLWYYIGSFYQPGKMVLNKLLLHSSPSANLSRYNVYKLLSSSKGSFFIKLFKGTISANYSVAFDNGKLKSVTLGTAGVPIVGCLLDSDEYVLPTQINIDTISCSLTELSTIQVPEQSKISYSKIATNGSSLYTYFGKWLFEYNLVTSEVTTYKIKDKLSIKKLENSEDFEGIKLLDDFTMFVSTGDVQTIWEPVK